MEQFASGWKRNYYGKGDVIVYRLRRDGSQNNGESPVFAANVKMLIYGDAFWPTYTKGDNTDLIATDSMKNFIQRETLNFTGAGLESLCQFLGAKFMGKYSQVEGMQISAEEIPYRQVGGASFAPGGPAFSGGAGRRRVGSYAPARDAGFAGAIRLHGSDRWQVDRRAPAGHGCRFHWFRGRLGRGR